LEAVIDDATEAELRVDCVDATEAGALGGLCSLDFMPFFFCCASFCSSRSNLRAWLAFSSCSFFGISFSVRLGSEDATLGALEDDAATDGLLDLTRLASLCSSWANLRF
jgi:hypothetical protein